MTCTHLKELVLEEENIIKRHMDEYMKSKNIKDVTEAKIKFVEEYGWIMKEIYCDLCPDNKTCGAYREFLEKKKVYSF